jgi:hypothetical protein
MQRRRLAQHSGRPHGVIADRPTRESAFHAFPPRHKILEDTYLDPFFASLQSPRQVTTHRLLAKKPTLHLTAVKHRNCSHSHTVLHVCNETSASYLATSTRVSIPSHVPDGSHRHTLPSTRNRPRTAVRQGAGWTAACHLQLTVAAVARPIGSSVGAPGVLAAERPWWLLAQTAPARRSVQPVSRGRASSPWSTLPAGTPRRRSPVSSRRCPPIRSRVSGIRLSSRPVSGHLGRSSRGPAVGRLLSTHPASSRPLSSRPLSSRPLSSRLVSAPAGPDASVSSHPGGGVGARSR